MFVHLLYVTFFHFLMITLSILRTLQAISFLSDSLNVLLHGLAIEKDNWVN